MAGRNLSRRSTEPELMDTETVDFEKFRNCLRHLEFVNICTLAYRPTLQWLREMWRGLSSCETVFVLDVGSGGGDMLRRIWMWSKNHGFKVTLAGVDINPWSKQSADRMTPPGAPISFDTGDVFSLNLPRRPDFIVSSLFCHHLGDDDLVRFIRWMDGCAARGWFINDLHRHPVAYYFIKFITRIIPVNSLVRHDAPVSVARSFTVSDWRNFLADAGIDEERVTVTWFFPFRYGVSCKKP